MKPLGIKNYGSIGHLPKSRMGSGDHHVHEGQARIATESTKDKSGKLREVFVQEKLDGSNCGVARVGDRIFPLTRSGYVADTSPFEQHHAFHRWVMQQQERWLALLQDGERVVGEWLMQAHSTKYTLTHEPFVVFDLMVGDKRLPYDEFVRRITEAKLTAPYLIHRGEALSVEEAMKKLGKFGFHGATDEVEGVMYRIELTHDPRNHKKPRQVEFMCKYVRPEKKDGIYLMDENGKELPPIFNWLASTPQ